MTHGELIERGICQLGSEGHAEPTGIMTAGVFLLLLLFRSAKVQTGAALTGESGVVTAHEKAEIQGEMILDHDTVGKAARAKKAFPERVQSSRKRAKGAPVMSSASSVESSATNPSLQELKKSKFESRPAEEKTGRESLSFPR